MEEIGEYEEIHVSAPGRSEKSIRTSQVGGIERLNAQRQEWINFDFIVSGTKYI